MNGFRNDYLRNLFIGIDKKVPILGGHEIVPINFDNAATTPVFKSVMDKIIEVSEDYGSIGRGMGQKSELTTKIYSECREYILNFFNAPSDKYTAIFVNNTTEGINRLSNMLIKDKSDIVVTTRMEHHSNDLPWRDKCNLKYVEVDELGRLKFEDLETILEENSQNVKYVSITAASNVTGYVNDIKKIAKMVHKHGAKLIIDGAQIVAHKRVDICGDNKEESVDFLVFSAHKMYAPFGSGAIIGLKEVFMEVDSDLKGGGTVEGVLDYEAVWLQPPEKDEAGSPNFFGAVALVQAMKNLKDVGYDEIDKNEKVLLKRALNGMKEISKVSLYGDVENIEDKLGIVVFNIDGLYNAEVAKILAQFRGIAVRQGAFCAHPYVKRLLKLTDEEACEHLVNINCKMPGMVRASFGLYNSIDEVDIFLNTIEWISKL
ncbi:aminotransferase class V-fold PLP-dependent enzyme [Clostridium sp.]|uniref:aminotransferase class V-fold PLP-dependent enzyme n=1 Tax=Clostridium sp. TaxID=1506 RepID=UPI003F3A53A7